jgi:4-hydroxybenzoate polyprenyltransferase
MNDLMLRFKAFIEQSHLFIALCASLLAVQSFLISQSEIVWLQVLLVFFSTLTVYNFSVLSLNLSITGNDRPSRISFTGERLNLTLISISVPAILLLLPSCNFQQAFIFLLVSLMALLYMMPVTINRQQLPAVRRHWLVKNILLALIWAVATVIIPLSGNSAIGWETETGWMLVRNFFFIYALTVIYDLRDLNTDSREGMKTLAMVAGKQGARIIALLALIIVVVLAFADESTGSGIRWSLTLSSLAAALVVIMSGPPRERSFYTWAVDGMMALQAILVIILH